MDEEVTTSFWISFFVEAGIPPAAAANYAIIFTENRIQKGMLLDLNKEYLKDMGISVLGDIIAILKHSKLYHEKAAREKVLATDKQLSVLKATKHLNEILQKDEPVKTNPPPTKESVTVVKVTSGPSPPKKLKVSKTESFKAAEDPEWVEQVEELKRKVIPPSVKLPSKNTTPVTKLVAKKTSVFDRLGESSVTSTTPEIPEPSVATTLKSPSSVFDRLGGLQITQKTVPPAKNETSAAARLVTKTVAATAAQTVVKKTISPSGSSIAASKMRMDIESELGKQSARQRLGLDVQSKKSASVPNSSVKTSTRASIASRIISGASATVKSTSSTRTPTEVKNRLGSVAIARNSTTSNSGSVFKRLGATRK